MAEFNVADRYAEAGLSPSADTIKSRSDTVDRITDGVGIDHILDLALAYYAAPNLQLTWLRDEFFKEDASFSLVNSTREVRVLAAIILGKLIAGGGTKSALAVLIGSVGGKVVPPEAIWLLDVARSALLEASIAERKPKNIEIKIASTSQAKLGEEITALEGDDWANLTPVLGKIRSEGQSSTKVIAAQVTSILTALQYELRIQREETQMLWWLTGGYSRSLERPFAAFEAPQAAIVAAVDLAALTTVSQVGPVAASAMLDRTIALSKKPKGHSPFELAATVDGFTREDLLKLPIKAGKVPPRLAPITAAIELARTIGSGAWHGRFEEMTGLGASSQFNPSDLAGQLYREHLLGQLL